MSTPQSKSAAFVVFILGVVVSAALGDPRPITGLVGQSALTPQQRDQIRTYAEFYCDQLATGDIPAVERAKRQLLDPMRALPRWVCSSSRSRRHSAGVGRDRWR